MFGHSVEFQHLHFLTGLKVNGKWGVVDVKVSTPAFLNRSKSINNKEVGMDYEFQHLHFLTGLKAFEDGFAKVKLSFNTCIS